MEICGFCVFWIPLHQPSHEPLEVIFPTLLEEYKDGDDKYVISSSLNEDLGVSGAEIAVSVQAFIESSLAYEYNIKLEVLRVENDGLMELKYSLDSKYVEDFKILQGYLYRHIKRHFHQHKYHRGIVGEISEGYYPGEKVDISLYDNKALEFYLKQINQVLREHTNFLLMEWEQVKRVLERNKQKAEGISSVRDIDRESEKELTHAFSEDSQGVLDQLIFLNTLIRSIRNRGSLIPYAGFRSSGVTCEINNSIAIITALTDRAKALFYDKMLESNDRMQKAMEKAGDISYAVGLISLALGLFSFFITVFQRCH